MRYVHSSDLLYVKAARIASSLSFGMRVSSDWTDGLVVGFGFQQKRGERVIYIRSGARDIVTRDLKLSRTPALETRSVQGVAQRHESRQMTREINC